ncbi:MAG: hypothetical protein L6R40_004019 [Gallowayella cf. fulva]|nr:MAG: hypothetical protein L6R40_004019 [Xanthomendoza cf. fulva]
MLSLSAISPFSALLLSSLTIASPVPSSPDHVQLNARAPAFIVNCTNPTAILDSSCWESLKVPDYLKSWRETYKGCNNSESWSTCFLRYSTGVAGVNCDTIDATSCNSADRTPTLDPAVQGQAHYAQVAILGVSQLFQGYNQVLLYSARSDIAPQEILQSFKTDHISLPNLSGLWSYLLPLGLNTIDATQTTSAPNDRENARIWADSLQAAPDVARSIWAPSPMNEQQLFLTATYSDLDITTLFDETLHLIMSNLDIFLAFADKGRFTARNAPDPFSLKGSSGIPSGRNTFLTSKLMEASGFYAVPGDVIDEAVYRSQHQCPEEATTLGAAICQAANNNDQCPPEATTLGAVSDHPSHIRAREQESPD